MRRFTNVWGLSLVLGACDVPGLEVEVSEMPPEAAEEGHRPPSEHDLRAGAQDPSEAGLLCVLCLLSGNKPVCGDDNQTYTNKCWATCNQAAVVHTGACKCGDGYAGPGEGCDDGNLANNDACLASCKPASCGDGHVWADHEACDDGNLANSDACLAGCVPASCGDGHVWAGHEGCDDGDPGDDDACPTTCQPASCGDGFVQAGVEACDDGNPVTSDGCVACASAVCGDGHVRAGVEVCDDGNADDTDGCLSTCTTAQCGDGFVQAGVEACDDGNADDTDGCLSTCLPASCGDGFVQAGVEACDDGDADDSDACLSSCEPASCGDGHVQAGVEGCDDANADDGDACLSTCEPASCGDGHLQAGVEACDDGDLDSDDACLATCQPAACGDGFVQAGVEACDDNNLSDNDACLSNCEPASCGDGVRWFGHEACDDGNAVDTDACRTDCGEAFCGDGVAWDGVESCDDGDDDDSDGCLSSCWPASCGDGHVQAGVETCDDANADDGDACPGNCQAASCGDGFVRVGVEDCDDGNLDPSDACTDACAPASCGDGAVHAGVEQCDDGDLVSGDGCSSACELEICGDGIVAVGEACDDGDNDDDDACSSECEGQAVLKIGAGAYHTCALLGGGVVKCFGFNSYGSLGLGDTLSRGDDPGEMGAALPAVDLGPGLVADSLWSGYGANCAGFGAMGIKCWGRNSEGRLGLGDSEHRGDDPGEMGAALPFVDLGGSLTTPPSVTVGERHTCAVLADGRVKCWGNNDYGQLGLGDVATRGDDADEMGASLPAVDLGPGVKAIAVSAGSSHTCALLAGGGVKCWGRGAYGQLGLALGNIEDRGDEPGEMGAMLPLVDLGGPVVDLSVGVSHSCALLADGRVKCWGANDAGQLGLGDTELRGAYPGDMGAMLPAVDLGPGVLAASVHVSSHDSCARLQDGRLKCWGQNHFGQLGLGNASDRGYHPSTMGNGLPFVDLGAGLSVVSLELGGFTSCATLSDGSAKCWGYNNSGQLGQGDRVTRGDNLGEMGDNLPRIKLFSNAW